MTGSSTLTFAQLLESAGLLPYQPQLLDEGFDDVDSLCNMTEGDMVKFGITSEKRIILERLFAQVRSARAATAPEVLESRPANADAMGLALDITAPQETLAGQSIASQVEIHGSREPAGSLLGSEMLVPASAWTSLTADVGFVQRLLALYFCWEYPIFASLSREHFVKDFSEGRSRYCSPILVHALLALGYCFSSRQVMASTVQDAQPSGDQFFKEALRLLLDDQDQHLLTTVQALGIMSVRESSCGRDSESRHYSGQSLRLAVEMGLHRTCKDGDDDESIVQAATFWGAFALNNAWALLSRSLPSCSSGITTRLPLKPPASPDIEASVWVYFTDEGVALDGLREQTSHVRSVFKCFCELSELIHDALYVLFSPVKAPPRGDVLKIYTKYLNWYDLVPDLLRLGHNSTPPVLFTHIYYHFAILQLFQPFVNYCIPGSNTYPREVCFQATNAISAILRSYSQLYTFRRIPSFMPHIILTSSIMHFSLHNSLSRGQSYPHLQPSSFLLYQLTNLINQHIIDLADMAPCHHSAKRTLYVTGILAKKDNSWQFFLNEHLPTIDPGNVE
ncbi:fungal specific transcription factor [Hirsutella rhossiliensis]|uniref:Fungal specific transcription factor domain-containing protein n=1 Tax=Hirsutella rhossiliensis TaxID=111463 RepID=A0A9P8SPF8_9HYPO|nr:fungal specific transcription factor domain-containing protein [Hirsutella rhossiliensis]KAH0968166.1 fungal specific transcription factor domain-containing protein [Hirsutella rhossiliensis]